MNQGIPQSYLEELSDKGKDALKTWLNEKGHAYFKDEVGIAKSDGSVVFLPLLTIGQMIHILEDDMIDITKSLLWIVRTHKDNASSEELRDSLWKLIKRKVES